MALDKMSTIKLPKRTYDTLRITLTSPTQQIEPFGRPQKVKIKISSNHNTNKSVL